MAKKQFYSVKETIHGVEYTAQFGGISLALRAADETYLEGASVTSTQKLADFIFENVIVDPKGLTADDFESTAEFKDVLKFGQSVMNGDFRNKTDKAGDKGTSTK